MTEYLTLLNYPLDTRVLLESAAKSKLQAESYTDSRYPDYQFDYWRIGHYIDEHIEKIMTDFEVTGKPRFYWLKSNAYLPTHVDNGTTCSINFILSDNPSPVTFNRKNYLYKQALLNTSTPHSVFNTSSERILLKISIFDETYKQLAQRIKYKLLD